MLESKLHQIDDYPYLSKISSLNANRVIQYVAEFEPVIWGEKEVSEKLSPQLRAPMERFEGEYMAVYDNWKSTEHINNTTDLFSEQVRVRCNFKKFASPLSYWNSNKARILAKIKRTNIHALREYIYSNTKLCNNFRITVAVAILRMFKPKKWLDISAGWGDRLLAAVLHGVECYVAADPNLDLQPCYNKIIQTFIPVQNRSNFVIYPTGFEIAPIPDKKFDLVFSSPPFFDLEQYSKHPDDSLQYNTESEWCSKFLWPSLMKAYMLLKRNGHMILYMTGSPKVMAYLKKLDDIMKYKGAIYYIDSKPRAMYVWQKTISAK